MTVKLVFLDVETFAHRGLFWGLFNQTLSIDKIEEPGRTLCGAWKWQGKKTVEFASEWHPVDEQENWYCYKEFLKQLHKVLDEADVVVTYNGKRFDIPTLNKEFVVYGLSPPAPFHHIDLYQTVKRQFRFASNKLDYICQQLGLGAKTQHKGMQLWKDVDKGCPKARKVMERYNKQDVVLLEKLYNHIKPWIKNLPNFALMQERAGLVCPSCGSEDIEFRGWRYTKTRRYRRFCCGSCHSWGSLPQADKDFHAETTST